MPKTNVRRHTRKTKRGTTTVRQHNRNIKTSNPKPNYKNPKPNKEYISVKEYPGISRFKGEEINKHGILREVGKIGNQEVFIEEAGLGTGIVYYNTRTKNLVGKYPDVPSGAYVYRKLPSDRKGRQAHEDLDSDNVVKIK